MYVQDAIYLLFFQFFFTRQCDCCGIYSAKDWKVTPKSCSELKSSRNCFDYIGYANEYNEGRNGTLPSLRRGCLGLIMKSVKATVRYGERDFTIFYIVIISIAGIMLFMRFMMFIPCMCIKKKLSRDKQPLIPFELDSNLIKA